MSRPLEGGTTDCGGDSRSIYRVVALDDDVNVNPSTVLSVTNDEIAKMHARRMAKGFAVELWNELRFIEHFDSRESR